ncbi:MAG TPA: threonine-phosphate decarboxylase CobD [Geobacteraceae bacterium]|nr:threonine-phosphate decarboxylase CobD [Geobacteraceae bacterium]
MTKQFQHGGTIFAVARELGIAPEELIDFSASINPLGPPPGVRDAVIAAFDRTCHYPDSGSAELRQLLAVRHGLLTDQVTVANGSTELIHLIPRLERFGGRRALLLAPTFSEYVHGLELSGWNYDYLPLSPKDGFSLDLAAVRQSLARGYDLLYLCNPGNPTGRLYRGEEVAALLDLCAAAGTFCVLDEAFMDFCEEESACSFLGGSDRLLILRSMTKFFGFPGVRLGYALGPANVIAGLERLRPPWSVGVLAQAAGIAALADGEHAEKSRELVASEREHLHVRLGEIPGLRVYPGAANYLLVEILLSGTTAAKLQQRLLAQRILIRDCGNFAGLDGSFFRVAVRCGVENERLLRGVAGALG